MRYEGILLLARGCAYAAGGSSAGAAAAPPLAPRGGGGCSAYRRSKSGPWPSTTTILGLLLLRVSPSALSTSSPVRRPAGGRCRDKNQ